MGAAGRRGPQSGLGGREGGKSSRSGWKAGKVEKAAAAAAKAERAARKAQRAAEKNPTKANQAAARRTRERADRAHAAARSAEPKVINPHTGKVIDVPQTAESVVRHSYQKHVVKKHEFPAGTTEADLEEITGKVIKTGQEKVLTNGKVAYWKPDKPGSDRGTLVILNPKQKDGEAGSVYRPSKGRQYFERLS